MIQQIRYFSIMQKILKTIISAQFATMDQQILQWILAFIVFVRGVHAVCVHNSARIVAVALQELFQYNLILIILEEFAIFKSYVGESRNLFCENYSASKNG